MSSSFDKLKVRTERGVRHCSTPSDLQELVRSSMEKAKIASSSSAASVTDGSVGMAVSTVSDVKLDTYAQSRDDEEEREVVQPSARTFKVLTEDGRHVLMTKDEMNEYLQQTIDRARRSEGNNSSNGEQKSPKLTRKDIEKMTGQFRSLNTVSEERESHEQQNDTKDETVLHQLRAKHMEESGFATREDSPERSVTKKPLFGLSPISPPKRRFSWSSVEESDSCDIDDDTLAYQSDVLVDNQGQLRSTLDLPDSNSDDNQDNSQNVECEGSFEKVNNNATLYTSSDAAVDVAEAKDDSPRSSYRTKPSLSPVNTSERARPTPEVEFDVSPRSQRLLSAFRKNIKTKSPMSEPREYDDLPLNLFSSDSDAQSTPFATPTGDLDPKFFSLEKEQVKHREEPALHELSEPRHQSSESPLSVKNQVAGVDPPSNHEAEIEQFDDPDLTLPMAQDSLSEGTQEEEVAEVFQTLANTSDEANNIGGDPSGTKTHSQHSATLAVEELVERQETNPSPSIPFDERDDYASLNPTSSADVFEGLSSSDEDPKRVLETVEEEPEILSDDGNEAGAVSPIQPRSPARHFDGDKETTLQKLTEEFLPERPVLSTSPISKVAEHVLFQEKPRKLFTPTNSSKISKLETRSAPSSPSRTFISSPLRFATTPSSFSSFQFSSLRSPEFSMPSHDMSPSKRLAAIPSKPEVQTPLSRDGSVPVCSQQDPLVNKEDPRDLEEVLILMNTLSDLQRDEQTKVDLMKRAPGPSSGQSLSSEDEGNDAQSRRSSASRRSRKADSRKRKSPRKTKTEEDSKTSRRSRRRNSPQKNRLVLPELETKKSSDDESRATTFSQSSVVVDDDLIKALASKKGSVMTAEDINKILGVQPTSPKGTPQVKKAPRHRVTVTHGTGTKPSKEEKEEIPREPEPGTSGTDESDKKEPKIKEIVDKDETFQPISLLAKTRGSTMDKKINERKTADARDHLLMFTPPCCLNMLEFLEIYPDDDTLTLEDNTYTSNREWIGSVLDFGPEPSSTLEETETEPEPDSGVFGKLAEELHTIMEVSSEENSKSKVEIPDGNQSFSFSQGSIVDLSRSMSNTDNEIEPGWWRQLQRKASPASSPKNK